MGHAHFTGTIGRILILARAWTEPCPRRPAWATAYRLLTRLRWTTIARVSDPRSILAAYAFLARHVPGERRTVHCPRPGRKSKAALISIMRGRAGTCPRPGPAAAGGSALDRCGYRCTGRREMPGGSGLSVAGPAVLHADPGGAGGHLRAAALPARGWSITLADPDPFLSRRNGQPWDCCIAIWRGGQRGRSAPGVTSSPGSRPASPADPARWNKPAAANGNQAIGCRRLGERATALGRAPGHVHPR